PVPALFIGIHRVEGAHSNPLLAALLEAANDNRALSVRSLTVGTLSQTATLELAARLLECDATDSRALAVASESGGSPFFAGALAMATGHRDLPALSLDGVLAAHVASLGESAERTLQAIALAGRPVPVAVVLQAVAPPEGYEQIDALRRARLIRLSESR